MKLVLFDCDGTLANSEAFIMRMARQTFRAFGAEDILLAHQYEFLRMSFVGFCDHIRPSLTDEQYEQIKPHYLNSIRDERDKGGVTEPIYDGVVEVLETLNAAGYLLGVVTNKVGHGLNAVLKSNAIDHLFVTLHHATNSLPKPAPDMVLNALAATGVEKKNCIVVGDTMMDVLVAKNAGVRVIGAQWGVKNALDGADCLVDRVEDLPRVLAEMLP